MPDWRLRMLSKNALSLLEKRYFLPGETWEGLIHRVVTTISKNRKTQEKYATMMYNLDFLPNTPCLINAGARTGQLMACFVLPIEDDMDSIFDGIKHAALIHKSGGGTGFSFSRLREAGAKVASTEGISSGPVSFMRVYNEATGAVKQGGVRRGANMGILSVTHPDIREFITCKKDLKQLTNFNISVAVSTDFMEAYRNDEDYALISPHSKLPVKTESAREIMRLIAQCAHENGEPGVVFIDEINKYNPTPHLGTIEATNPCGEQPLLPYEACVLGSINLANMVKDGKVNEEKLTDITAFATLFLDDVITTSIYPLERVKTMVTATRKIGLGVMGWADMLAQLSIPYDSPEAIQLSNQVMELISITAKEVSNVLGEQMLPYPANKSYIQCRNATVTTIAPTGSISMIADCSSGIEPYFSLAYTKTVLDGEEFKYINPYLQKVLTEKGLWNDKVEKTVLKTGSIQGIAEIPEDIRNVFKIAKEISPTTHIDMQAEFQKNVDNAVSKTINLPKSATVEEIEQIYLHAYETKCKGITVYRDGSRDVQVLSIGYSAKSGVCPECGSKVDHAEGCVSCKACGWAVCE